MGHFCPFDGEGQANGCPRNGSYDTAQEGWKDSTKHGTNNCIIKCPAKTYNDKTGATSQDACKACDNCGDELANISDKTCDAGTDCQTGLPCDPGYYCPENKSIRQACPPGTYMLDNKTGSETSDDCLPCKENYYCPDSAMFESNVENFECSKSNYFCESGSAVETPSVSICPIGSYCVNGKPQICADSDETTFSQGAEICVQCADGYNCQNGADLCGEGSYCEGGSVASCPFGTISQKIGLSKLSECSPCDMLPMGHVPLVTFVMEIKKSVNLATTVDRERTAMKIMHKHVRVVIQYIQIGDYVQADTNVPLQTKNPNHVHLANFQHLVLVLVKLVKNHSIVLVQHPKNPWNKINVPLGTTVPLTQSLQFNIPVQRAA